MVPHAVHKFNEYLVTKPKQPEKSDILRVKHIPEEYTSTFNQLVDNF